VPDREDSGTSCMHVGLHITLITAAAAAAAAADIAVLEVAMTE